MTSLAEAVDGVGEVEVHAVLQRADAAAGVDLALGVAGGDVARHEVAERRVAALEEVVALGLGDLVGRAGVVGVLRHPDAAVVAQRLRHQRELRLELVALPGCTSGGSACSTGWRTARPCGAPATPR